MVFEYAIALTGSIATGKSTVSGYFTSFGFTVIDADTIAHKILDEQYEVIVQMFGKGISKNAKVDRKALGSIVFSDVRERKKLESLLHPFIFDEIENQATKEDRLKKPYFIDIPLFFETKRYPIHKSLVVYTPKLEQLKRLMQRDGYTKKEAASRIEMQMDIEEKRMQATYVIDNSMDILQLKDECKRVKEKILGDFK